MGDPIVVRCKAVEKSFSAENYFPEIECTVELPPKDNYQTIDYNNLAFSVVSCGAGVYTKKPMMCIPLVKWFSDNARELIKTYYTYIK